MESQVEIIKSTNDSLEYKFIELENKMKCILIKDDKTEKSAVVVSVGVGWMEDPSDTYGLAHLLEHMLFMGNSSFCYISKTLIDLLIPLS